MPPKDKSSREEQPERAVMPASGTEVAIPDYGEDSGMGFSPATSSDYSIPFLGVLQANSPQVVENNPEGARAGLLYNSVTGEMIDGSKGLVIIPVLKQNAYVEWIHRDNGGGLVANHLPESHFVMEVKRKSGTRGKLRINPDDEKSNQLIETVYLYCLILEEDNKTVQGHAVVSFTVTKLKPWRNFYTQLLSIKYPKDVKKPPFFAYRVRLSTFLDQNKKGQKYYNYTLEPAVDKAVLAKLSTDDGWKMSLLPAAEPWAQEVLAFGKKMHEMVMGGMAKVDFGGQGMPEMDHGAGADWDEGGEKAPF